MWCAKFEYAHIQIRQMSFESYNKGGEWIIITLCQSVCLNSLISVCLTEERSYGFLRVSKYPANIWTFNDHWKDVPLTLPVMIEK